jgi:hypothetical protein
MAEFTRVNGTAFGVVNVDRGTAGSGDVSVAELVQLHGRSLAFFAVVIKNTSNSAVDISNEMDALEAVEAVLRTAQGGDVGGLHYAAGIVAYQVEAAGGQISLCLEGGNWTASALQTAVRALGTAVGANSIDVSGTTVTNVGFKLALS